MKDDELSTLMALNAKGPAQEDGKEQVTIGSVDEELARFAIEVTQSLVTLSAHQALHCKKIMDLEDKVAALEAMLQPMDKKLVN